VRDDPPDHAMFIAVTCFND